MPVCYAKESARSRGPGVKKSIHWAFRKIERETVGVLRDCGQAGRGREGVGLVRCHLEVRENPEQRRIMGRFEFGRSLLLPHWGWISRVLKAETSAGQSPAASPLWGPLYFCVRSHQKEGPGHRKTRRECRVGLAPHSHADKRQVTLGLVETGSSRSCGSWQGCRHPTAAVAHGCQSH